MIRLLDGTTIIWPIEELIVTCPLFSGAVAGGARGGHGPPYCRDPSENCQCCRKLSEIVKVVGGGGGGEDLKCFRPENFLVCRKKIFGLSEKYCPWPPPKKTWVPRRHCPCCKIAVSHSLSSLAPQFRTKCFHFLSASYKNSLHVL